MSATQPLSRLARLPVCGQARTTRIHRICRALVFVLVAMLGGTLPFSTVHAQTPQVSLVTLVTDQTPLNLSNHFGVPNLAIVNQNGDYAFVGEGYGDINGHGEGSALFLRRAGAPVATRLLQFGDPVPGMAGDTAVEFNVGGLNSSGHLLVRVDYTVSPPDGQLHRAFLIYDGVSTYRTVVTSDTAAPGSGQKFGPDLGCPGSACLDNNDDVVFTTDFEPFAGANTVPNHNTYYIAPAGGTPVYVVGLGDPMPGVSNATFTTFGQASQLNALGQFLFSGQSFNGTTTINGLFLASASGVTKVVATGDPKPPAVGGTFSPVLNLATDSGELNDGGQVAFVDPVSGNSPVATVWLDTGGSLFETDHNSAGSPIILSGLSTLGSAIGSLNGGQSVVRIHSGGVIDTIATTAQAAPGVSGATFTAFYDLGIDNNDRAIFTASLSLGGTGIYQQTGTATPVLVALNGQSSGLSGGGTLNLSTDFVLPKALDSGSTFFSATISEGAANFAEYLGTPTSLQELLSSADTLPAGARVRLSLPTSNSGNGNNNSLFVGFTASLAGGQTAFFVKDVIQGTTTRIVSEGDAIPGFGGATFVLRSLPFYMNGNGQVVFSASLSNGALAILLAGPTANLVTKAAATGEIAPVTGNPTIVGLGLSNNTTALSPINDSGQVAFYAGLSNGLNGIFLFDGGTTLFKIATSGDTVPEGGATFAFFSSSNSASLGINSNGQVAFGATKFPTAGGTATGLYIGFPGGSPTKVAASGDIRPGSSSTFGLLDPVSGFNDNGQIVFEAVNGGGVFTGPGTGATPTVTAVALDGTTTTGTNGGGLATSTPAFSTGSFSAGPFITDNAAIDNAGSGNFVFQSRVTGAAGGTPNSGYFRVLDNSGLPGPLQAAVLQGQTVTGTGTLGTMFPSVLNNAFFSLESNGGGNGANFIFTNSFTNAGGTTMVGQFFSATGIPVLKLMVPGDAIPGTGGGVYSTGTGRSQNHQDTPTFEVLTAGGTTTQALVFAVTEGGTVNTTTTLVSLLNPSGIGVSTEFTATVTSPQGPPPIGDIVAFFDNGVEIGVGFTDSNGNATLSTGSLSAGSHPITAEYFPSGNNNNNTNVFLTSTSTNVVTQVVSNATETLLLSTQNPSVPGQSVLFEALVFSSTGAAQLPTGTVTFLDGATTIGSADLSSEVALFSTLPLSAGTHTITAQYLGDGVFTGSISTAVTQVVQSSSSPSATALSSSVSPSVAGQLVTFTATVSGSNAMPTGFVTFLDNGAQIGTGVIATGTVQATFTTSTLAVGPHRITAQYSGDVNFNPSTSNSVAQTVNTNTTSPSPSATALGSSVNPSATGQSVTFTASVQGSGGGTPTGTVSFFDNTVDVQLGIGTLTGGVATVSTSLAVGSHAIMAQYSGDANFSPSTSNPVTQVVQTTSPTPSATALFSSVNPSVAGQTVTFTAPVNGSGGITPTGTVAFRDSEAQIGTGTVISGQATFSTSSLAVGSHPITAQYSGDTNFSPSTSNPVTQMVMTAATVLTSITVTPNPAGSIPAGSTEQFTATGHYSDSSTQDLTTTATWNSSNTAAATISNATGSQGLATGVTSGSTTTITASLNGVVSPGVSVVITAATVQSSDTSGTDFWLTFPQNVSATPSLNLFIAGNTNTTGTVAIPALTFSMPFTVTAGQITTVSIPSGAQLQATDLVQSLGIHVTAQNNVTVYGLNHVPASTDGYLGLPTAILGTSYIVLGFQGGSGSQFAVVGTANGTTVNITPSVTVGTRTAGTPYAITLNQGQTYQLTDGAGTDLTGTIITSNQPIAVFGGNQCTPVPSAAYAFCNYLVEELPPTSTWGKNFFTVPLATRSGGDTFRFLAGTNQTHVSVNGVVVATLNQGQFFQQLIVGASQITADQPILVAQYSNSESFDNASSDPFMILVPPAAQYLASYTVTAPSTGFSPNFVNIAAPTSGTGTITLDGTVIAANLFTAIGSTGFSGAQVPLTVGSSHTLTGSVPFGTIVYGFASADGYGYAGGFSLSPIATVTAVALAPKVVTGVIGTQACVTATVTDQNSAAVVGVRVDFTVTGVNPTTGFANTASNGQAQFCYTGAVAGADTVTGAVGTISDTATVNWTGATIRPSATALASSLDPSFAGQSVTFTAAVNGASGGTPTGTVTFLDNGLQIGTGTVNNGLAAFGTVSLAVGSHSVTAAYGGDSNFSPSTSNVVTQAVNISVGPTPTPTFIAIASSPNPAAVGASVQLTAIVSGSTGVTPTGNVTFLDNGTPLGTGVLNGSGVATFSTSSLAAGSHPITAQYSGDANFALSLSALVSETIGSGPPPLSVQISPVPQNVSSGENIQFGAFVFNAGTNSTAVVWQLTGPGSLDQMGNYTAPSTSSSQQPVVVTATSVADPTKKTSIEFTLAADALKTTTPLPGIVTAGGTFTVNVQLSGVPPASTVPFTLSCGNLPVATTCVFNPPSVTGTNPNFTVMIVTSGGTSTTQLGPLPALPGGPWYALCALLLPALAMIGLRHDGRRRAWLPIGRQVFFKRNGYAFLGLALLCLTVVFLASCTGFSPPPVTSVAAPAAKAITPTGSYQVVVTATPQAGAGGNFVQTQLIVPVTVN